ncbi:cobalt-precorrin-5B (C(1))-methyltransferase [Paenibacillus sp. TRM 82003]|nr:cobalt-precorrin-5B (C(1))-methyltransferase [Paenibacillus sp. TRM 82003]
MKEAPDKQSDGKPLRHGFTTGACAAATAKGAALMLLTQRSVDRVDVWLPAGFSHTFQLIESEFGEGFASCATIKDGGDDPDATHLAKIVAAATWRDSPGVEIDGGIGVGRATKPGLPMSVGEAAINPVPRRMILEAVQSVLDEAEETRGVRIVISVPEGEEIAKKTLNGRLGIVGGISILGTRGTVVPFSTSAYKASIVQAMQVARATGCEDVVLTTGGSSEKYAMKLYGELPEEAFVQMGDFVGFSLKQAKRLGLKRVRLVGMMGKFSKVAQGVMMVHSKSAPVDFGFLADVAASCGASEETRRSIAEANTASQAGDIAAEAGLTGFFEALCRHASTHAAVHAGGGVAVETVLVTMKGDTLGRAEFNE